MSEQKPLRVIDEWKANGVPHVLLSDGAVITREAWNKRKDTKK